MDRCAGRPGIVAGDGVRRLPHCQVPVRGDVGTGRPSRRGTGHGRADLTRQIGDQPASVDRDGNLHLIAAAEKAGASFVMVSVIGAAADSRVELFRMKYAAEQRLRASRCRWTIVRADAYAETWRAVMEQTAGKSHRPLVFGNGDTPISFVSVEDVIPLVVRAVLDPDLTGRVLEICGPEAVSMSQLAAMAMERREWSGRPRRVPRPVLHLVANTVGVVKPTIRRQVKAALAVDELPTRTDHSLRQEFPGLNRTAVSAVIAGT